VIAKNAVLWHLACDALQKAKTSKDFATIEKQIDFNKIFLAPEIKTDKTTGYLTRKVSWNADYYIVASFDKHLRPLLTSMWMHFSVRPWHNRFPMKIVRAWLKKTVWKNKLR
jgi:hypothetical protein